MDFTRTLGKSKFIWGTFFLDEAVSISRGTLKWVVYRENPIKNDDLGVPIFWETSMLNKQKYNDCH